MDRLHELIAGKPEAHCAIIDHDGARISYGELRQRGAEMAEVLRAAGLQPGDRLILVAENCALYAAAVMAASMCDLWLVLVNARQRPEELAAIASHSGARAAVFTAHVSPDAAAHAERVGAREIARIGADAVRLALLDDAARPEPVEPGAGQVAALIYTTGTTAAPKGVMLTHDNLIFSSVNGGRYFGTGPDDLFMGVLPGTHIYALSSVFLNAMAVGATIRMIPRFDPAAMIGHLRAGATRMNGVPQMYAAMLAHLDRTGERLEAPRLRFIGTGGAPLDPGLKARVEAVFGLPLCNGYGLTETAPSVSSTHPDDPRDDTSVGVPYPWIEVRIAEPDGEGIGEIQVRGRNVMKGYYRDPERTAEAMTADGFFRTGDLGRFDASGALHVVGRLKELIIRSGFNVHPPEVEAMLSRHPAVYSAAVVGRKVPGNEEILAFVKARPGISGEELRGWLRQRLAGYKVPQAVFVVDDWPAAATGKVLKHKLLDHFAGLIAQRDAEAQETG